MTKTDNFNTHETAVATIELTDDGERNLTSHEDDAAKYEPSLPDAETNVEAVAEHTPPLGTVYK